MYKSLPNIGEVCFFVNMKQPWRDITLLKAIAGRLRELRAEKGVSQETVYEDSKGHTHVKIGTRLTPRGYARLWDAAVTNLREHGTVLPTGKALAS